MKEFHRAIMIGLILMKARDGGKWLLAVRLRCRCAEEKLEGKSLEKKLHF